MGVIEQVRQKPAGVIGIHSRIEGRIQAGKGIGMVHQVDLHAAHVDRPDASRLHRPHRADRLRLGVIEGPLPLGVDGPRPGVGHAGGRVPAAAFHPADRRHQPMRHAMGAFRRLDGRAAQQRRAAHRQRRGFAHGRDGQAKQHENKEIAALHGLRLAAKDERRVSSFCPGQNFLWCNAKNRLQTNDLRPKFRLAATRSLTVLSAFLDVSSLNLAAPRAPPLFCTAGRGQPHGRQDKRATEHTGAALSSWPGSYPGHMSQQRGAISGRHKAVHDVEETPARDRLHAHTAQILTPVGVSQRPGPTPRGSARRSAR